MPIKKHPFNNLETFNNCLCRELTLWGHLRFDGTLFAAAIQFLYSLKVGKLGPAPATIWFRHQAQMRAIHTTIWVPLSAQINYIIYIMQRGAWMLRGFKGGTCKPPIWNRPVHIDTQLVRACWSQNRVQYLESVRRNLSSCFSLCLASHAQQLIRRPSWFWKKQRRARCPLPSLQLSTCFSSFYRLCRGFFFHMVICSLPTNTDRVKWYTLHSVFLCWWAHAGRSSVTSTCSTSAMPRCCAWHRGWRHSGFCWMSLDILVLGHLGTWFDRSLCAWKPLWAGKGQSSTPSWLSFWTGSLIGR